MYIRNLLPMTNALYDDRKAIHLIGPPGCGKSTIATKDMFNVLHNRFKGEFGKVVEFLTSYDAPDIKGFCIPTKEADGTPVSVFTLSALAKKVRDTGFKQGVLVLDEYGQAEHIVIKPSAPIILDGLIGDFQMETGWWVIMCSNRQSDRAGVNRPLTHVVNRYRQINIEVDLSSLATHFERIGMHPMGISFLKARPGVVVTNEVPAGTEPFCTPRSYVSAMRFLAAQVPPNSMNLPDDSVTSELVSGDVGSKVAMEMFAYFKVANELPTIEEVLNDPATAKIPKPEKIDAQFAAMQMCVHFADAKNVDKLFSYITRLKKEMQTSAAKSMIDKSGGTLINSKALTKFIAENRALINSSLL